VLIITGESNHDWQATTPILSGVLESLGGHQVDINTDPASLTAEALAPYDALVVHWTNFPSAERTWADAAEAAVLGFVEAGGGIVFVHAAAACFPGWEEYERLKLAAWEDGVTGHGAVHRFPVRVVEGPFAEGLGEFETTDELWHEVDIEPEARVIAEAYSSEASGGTGDWEPIALAAEYGGGRAFTLLLGHDTAAMGSPGFQKLLARGVRWAATGEALSPPPPLDQALEDLSGYDYGSNRHPVLTFRQIVHSTGDADALVEPLLAFLKTDAPRAAKEEVLRALGLVGAEEDLASIGAWARDPDLRHAALAAIERIEWRGYERAGRPAVNPSPEQLRDDFASGDPARVLAAAGAMLEAGDTPPLGPIHALLESDSEVVVRSALDLLRRTGDESFLRPSAALPQGLENLALAATASSPDGLEKDGQASGDAAANDGDPETYWDEADGADEYRLVLTWDEPITASALRITAWAHHDYAPRDFEVVCDGQTLERVLMAQYDDGRFALTFEPTECESLELRITGYYGQSPAIRELEVFDVGE
jgi:hypothetical protein